MLKFVSKVQHNTYEKGEFSDEQIRTLDETIQLIKTFPFDAERTLTDIQLTGPSVTIKDENLNYLKVSLYFNGKLCVYYLDNDNHLYEYYATNVDNACEIVKTFFEDSLDLQKFERHLFVIGPQKHFEDKQFDYRANPVSYYWRLLLSAIFFSLMVTIGTIFQFIEAPVVAKIGMTLLCTIFGILIAYTIFLNITYYRKSKNMFLHLSAGNNLFEFGTGDQIITYNKTKIGVINIYGSPSSKGTPIYNIIEIIFNDKSTIQFPVMLIDQFDFQAKFPGNKINIVDKISEVRKKRLGFALS